MLQEPQIERREHQDNSDVYYQPLPEPVPEEQDVHADHDGYQREHVKHDRCLSSHPSFLLRAAEIGSICPLSATSRHMRCSKGPTYSISSSARSRLRDRQAERLRSGQIDDEIEFGRLL